MVASKVRIKQGEEILKVYINKSIGMLRNMFRGGNIKHQWVWPGKIR